MKSQEQRIKDAAEVVANIAMGRLQGGPDALAAAILKAADREPQKWPTDESVRAFDCGAFGIPVDEDFEAIRHDLRASLLADPIIKAAIAYRDNAPAGSGDTWRGKALLDAVNEAGL